MSPLQRKRSQHLHTERMQQHEDDAAKLERSEMNKIRDAIWPMRCTPVKEMVPRICESQGIPETGSALVPCSPRAFRAMLGDVYEETVKKNLIRSDRGLQASPVGLVDC